MARDVRFIINGETNGAEAALNQLKQSGASCANHLELQFASLGIRSSQAIEQQRAAYTSAFEKIKASGVASAAEIVRAQDALTAKMARLDKEQGLTTANDGAKRFGGSLEAVGTCVDRLNRQFQLFNMTVAVWFVGGKILQGFKMGIQAVDDFQQSVVKTAAMITSLQGGDNVAENYAKAKQYAEGLNQALQKVDAKTTLNLTNLQDMTEEMIKQGVVLDYNDQSQLDAFTKLANAAAVYSNNGKNEVQLRQEVRALLMGQVDQNSQLAQMVQRMVNGDLKKMVEQWKQQGTLVENLGKLLSGFGPAATDLAETWGAVTSSLKTSLNLLAQAGLTSIVKEMSGWIDRANEYLKTHKDLIANKIKDAWNIVKIGLEGIWKVLGFILNHTTAFGALLVGGAVINGVMGLVRWFVDLRKTVMTVTAAITTMNAALALSGKGAPAKVAVAGAGGIAEGVGAGAGAAAGAGGWMAKAGLVGLAAGGGYFIGTQINDIADRVGMKYFGKSLTGKPEYEDAQARGDEAEARYQEIINSEKYKKAKAAAGAPQLKLGKTPEQITEELKLKQKDLSAFKEEQDRKTALAKAGADNELLMLKNKYDQGLMTTKDYYDKETSVAVQAAQSQFDNAEALYGRQLQLLTYTKTMKGKDSPEALEEMAKEQKALLDMELAEKNLEKVKVESGNREMEALKKQSEEYQKLNITTLEASGKYVEAEQAKQALDSKSVEYIRMKTEATANNAEAVEALASVEQKRTLEMLSARTKEASTFRNYAKNVADSKAAYEDMTGASEDLLKAESALRDNEDKIAALKEEMMNAWVSKNTTAITQLGEQLTWELNINDVLQKNVALATKYADEKLRSNSNSAQATLAAMQGNNELAEALRNETEARQKLVNMEKSLKDAYVQRESLMKDGTREQINLIEEEIDAFERMKEIQDDNVQAAKDLVNALKSGLGSKAASAGSNPFITSISQDPWFQTHYSTGIHFVDANGNALSTNAVGTRYITKTGLHYLHEGESVNNAREVREASEQGASITIGSVQFVLPNVTNQSTARDLARNLYPELKKLAANDR